MISGLVLSHGKIAEAFVQACKQIAGECRNLYTLNCDNLTPKDLHKQIAHLVETENFRDGLFILVSLRGGSCWNAAAKIAREYENIKLISGLNLSILLSFVTKRDKYNFEDLADILCKDGARAITRLN